MPSGFWIIHYRLPCASSSAFNRASMSASSLWRRQASKSPAMLCASPVAISPAATTSIGLAAKAGPSVGDCSGGCSTVNVASLQAGETRPRIALITAKSLRRAFGDHSTGGVGRAGVATCSNHDAPLRYGNGENIGRIDIPSNNATVIAVGAFSFQVLISIASRVFRDLF
jgi:hypothetical protein